MSNEQLRRIAVALGVMLVLWAGLRLVQGRGRDAEAGLPPPRFDHATVDTIRLERPTDTLLLVRQADGWTVNGFRAAASSVDELLGALTDTSATSELVAESPSSHTSLGVDSAGARRLTLKAGATTLVTYLIGKRGASWESAYVRRPGQDRVFQVRGRLVEPVERKLDDWRDRQIVHVAPDSLASVEVARGRVSYSLNRKDSTWVFAGGGAADSLPVANLLGEFRNLEGSGFATPAQADSANFETPDRRVTLTPRAGPAITLRFDSTTGGYWVRRDDRPTVFRLDSWVAGRLTPADSTLRKAHGAAPRP